MKNILNAGQKILVLVSLALFAVGALILGFAFFLALITVIAVASIAIFARAWWLKWKVGRPTRTKGRAEIIEGTFEVVSARPDGRKNDAAHSRPVRPSGGR